MPTAWVSISLCTAVDVATEVKGVPYFGDIVERSALVETKIQLVKRLIHDVLIERFPRLFPSTVAQVSQYAQFVYDSTMERLQSLARQTDSQTLEPTFGQIQAMPYFLNEFSSALPPQVFYFNGDVTNDLFTGSARNGAFLCEMRQSDVYVNHGTIDAPIWTLFDTNALIDRITNPSVMLDAAVAGTIWLLLEDASLGFTAVQDSASDLIETAIPRRKKLFDERLERAIGLLRIDMSGDGLISEFERTRTQYAALPFA